MLIILVEKFSFSSIDIGWLDPFSRNHTRQSDSDIRGAVEPARPRPPCEFLTQVGGEMVAVPCQQVVGCTLELFRGGPHSGVNLVGRRKSESMEYLTPECTARRFCLRLCPVYTCEATSVVSSVCIFSTVDNDTRVEERCSEEPESG
jgi:hypothetical protein